MANDSLDGAIAKKSGRLRAFALSVLAGAAAGLVAVLYRFALTQSEKICSALFALSATPLGIAGLFAILAAAGFAVGKLTQSEPLIKGSGIPQVEGQLIGYFSPRWFSVLAKKFIGGAIALCCGLSLGREGPSIQLGAMTAQGIGEKLKLTRVEKKYIIVCGAGAGLAAAFNAPLAGLMFTLEEVHKNFSPRAVYSAMLAALTADVVSKLFFGTEATLGFELVHTMPINYYLDYICIGVIMGAFGALYNKTLAAGQRLYGALKLPLWGKIMIPFMCAGVFGLFMPQVLGGGHGILEQMTLNSYSLGMLIALLAAKFLFSMISFCSGAPGGIFFPLLVLGALSGGIIAKSCGLLFGLSESYFVNFMLLGMVGMFSGIVRAPLTGIILVVEMSGSLTQLIGLSIVACVASLTAGALHARPVYEQLLDAMTPESAERRDDEDRAFVDMAITYESTFANKLVSELSLPQSALIVCVTRGAEQLIPKGATLIEPGDVLTIMCAAGDEAIVRAADDRPIN